MQAESKPDTGKEAKVAVATLGVDFLSCLSVALRIADLLEMRLNAIDWHNN